MKQPRSWVACAWLAVGVARPAGADRRAASRSCTPRRRSGALVPVAGAAWLVGAFALPDAFWLAGRRSGAAVASGRLGWTGWLLAGDRPRPVTWSLRCGDRRAHRAGRGVRSLPRGLRSAAAVLQWVAAAAHSAAGAAVIGALHGLSAYRNSCCRGCRRAALLPRTAAGQWRPPRGWPKRPGRGDLVAGWQYSCRGLLVVVVGWAGAVGRERMCWPPGGRGAGGRGARRSGRPGWRVAGACCTHRNAAGETLATFGARMQPGRSRSTNCCCSWPIAAPPRSPGRAEIWIGRRRRTDPDVSVPDGRRSGSTDRTQRSCRRTRIGAFPLLTVWLPRC